MEILLQGIIAVACAILFLKYAWRILNWAWLKPKKLEKQLRGQGIHGNSYRLFNGDLKDISKMVNEAKAKPMLNFSNDIVSRVIPFITHNINKYGRSSFLWYGPRPAVLILDPELIREVLAKTAVYRKLRGNPLTKLLVQGIATLETQKWAKHRRIINPAFTAEKVKRMLPAFQASCGGMLAKWERLVPTGGEPREIDVFPYLQTMASDAISRTAFGSNHEEGSRIYELQREQADLVLSILRTIYIPGWRFVPTKKNKRMKEIAKEVKSLFMDMINSRMKAVEAGEANSEDLLGVLLESNFREIQQQGSNKAGLSSDEVIEECKLFYLAGQETTAATVSWMMILLAKHLDWQARAREEILDAFGTRTPEYDELSHLKIVPMILNEVLRLYSPAPILSRMTTCETKLGETTLPSGVLLKMPVFVLHHDKEIWGDDAEEFKPERFKDGVSKAMKKGHASFFPFGSGPRVCIGQGFAMLEAKMAIVMILQRFSFDLSPSYLHAPHIFVILQPQHGARLNLYRL